LRARPCFHAYVIVDKVQENYLAVTKAHTNGGQITHFIDNIKSKVYRIQGTDILAYTLAEFQEDARS